MLFTQATQDGGTSGPDLESLILTVIITVVVTLLFDWWVRPRLEVRNELFKMRANDHLQLVRTLQSMTAACNQMRLSEQDKASSQLHERAAAARAKLVVAADAIQFSAVVLEHRLTRTTKRMIASTAGYIHGACDFDAPHWMVGRQGAKPVSILLDAVSAPKWSINYFYQHWRMQRYLEGTQPQDSAERAPARSAG
ncbi:hypothetical protein [Arthrobacter sp. Marseille-P9274]|uniref:hypothetical protein n=1 Tax=Arthrobacter sp. Marseille-P9274 TaxID=2866572 RepID=UPI0021C9B525|nr:hypothetical protein [Arthrobacter sp. Marseille-P9274]